MDDCFSVMSGAKDVSRIRWTSIGRTYRTATLMSIGLYTMDNCKTQNCYHNAPYDRMFYNYFTLLTTEPTNKAIPSHALSRLLGIGWKSPYPNNRSHISTQIYYDSHFTL